MGWFLVGRDNAIRPAHRWMGQQGGKYRYLLFEDGIVNITDDIWCSSLQLLVDLACRRRIPVQNTLISKVPATTIRTGR